MERMRKPLTPGVHTDGNKFEISITRNLGKKIMIMVCSDTGLQNKVTVTIAQITCVIHLKHADECYDNTLNVAQILSFHIPTDSLIIFIFSTLPYFCSRFSVNIIHRNMGPKLLFRNLQPIGFFS